MRYLLSRTAGITLLVAVLFVLATEGASANSVADACLAKYGTTNAFYYHCYVNNQYPLSLTRLGNYTTRLPSLQNTPANEISQVMSEITKDKTAVSATQSKVANETDVPTIRADLTALAQNYRISYTYIKASYLIVGDRINQFSNNVDSLLDTLQNRFTALGNTGVDVSAALSRIKADRAAIASAQTKMNQAIALVLPLKPDGGSASILSSNQTTIAQAKQNEAGAVASYQSVHSDVVSLIALYKSLSTPPSVSILAPQQGDTVAGTLTLSAAASTTAGLGGVQFQIDGTKLGAALTAAPFTAKWDTTKVKNGVHAISVAVRDSAGGVATSTINVAVSNSGTGPVPCAATVSGSGAKTYQVGAPTGNDNAQIQCAIDEAIKDLQSGAAQSATVRLQSGATYSLSSLPNKYDALFIETSDLSKQTFGPLTFDGQGSTLALARTTAGVYVNGCQNCTIQNLTIRDQTSPYAEGTLKAVTKNSVDIQVTGGSTFNTPAGYKNVVGKNDGLVIFHTKDTQAFPTGYEYPDFHSYVSLTSAQGSGSTEHITYDPSVPPSYSPASLPLNTTKVVAVASPLDNTKAAAVEAYRDSSAVIAQRKQYPQYGPAFFEGQAAFALFTEQNQNLTVRNVTMSDFPGNGIAVRFNRGPLTLDNIRGVPLHPGGLLSLASDAITAGDNEQGPLIENSTFINTGDDTLTLVSFPLAAASAAGATADLKSTVAGVLGSFDIRAGDTFRVMQSSGSSVGKILGTYTVVSATPYYISSQAYGYHVTFNKQLPTNVVGGDNAYFINLNESNNGMRIVNNAIIGGNRNGFYYDDSTTASGNLVAGQSLNGVGYYPFLLVDGGPDPWGNYGPVTLTGNTFIDTARGFLRLASSAKSGYMPPIGGITITGNTIFEQNTPAVPFYAVLLTDNVSFPITASGNTIVIPSSDPRTQGSDFLTGSGSADPWLNAFSIQSKSTSDLWNAKCAAVRANPLWLSAVQYAAPGACSGSASAFLAAASLAAGSFFSDIFAPFERLGSFITGQ